MMQTIGADTLYQQFGVIAKACPFCGNVRIICKDPQAPAIVCVTCTAQGPAVPSKGIGVEAATHRAVMLWNERARI
jgi:hypothetical protein